MKKLLFLAIVAILAFGCSKEGDYSIIGTWQGVSQTNAEDSGVFTFYEDGTALYELYTNGKLTDSISGTYTYSNSILTAVLYGGEILTLNIQWINKDKFFASDGNESVIFTRK